MFIIPSTKVQYTLILTNGLRRSLYKIKNGRMKTNLLSVEMQRDLEA